jgi:hypothetical protein
MLYHRDWLFGLFWLVQVKHIATSKINNKKYLIHERLLKKMLTTTTGIMQVMSSIEQMGYCHFTSPN